MLVTDIRHAISTRPSRENHGSVNYLHQITFSDMDGQVYIAEELEASNTSKFVKGQLNNFEVTFPGKVGGKDWVRFVGVMMAIPVQQPKAQGKAPSQEDLFIAQAAFNGAVQLGIKNKWDEEMICEKAHFFAGNIKLIAKQLADEFI